MVPTPECTLLRSAPYFPVGNVEESADYYDRIFGFKTEYRAGTPPEFAVCSRDGFAIMLRKVPAPDRILPNEKQGGTWDVFFWTDQALALHSELSAKGADVVYGPIVQEAYHMLEFAVRDRDGYILGFGQAVGS